MRKIAILHLYVAEYKLRGALEANFHGSFKFEETEKALNTLFWYPTSGLGAYTAERVVSFALGYCIAANIVLAVKP